MLRIKLLIIGFIGAAMLFTSCDDDSLGGGIGGGADGPTINFLENAGQNFTVDSTVEPSQVFRIQVEVTAGEADLQQIEVFLDSRSLDPSEFDILELDDYEEQNNAGLFGANAAGISWTYEFVAPSEDGFYDYSFTVIDLDGLETSNSININVLQTTPDADPMVTLNGPTTLESAAGSLNSINITADMGSNSFESISVWEDGVLIDTTRLSFLTFDNTFAFNPLPLFSPEAEGFTGAVFIRSIPGNHDYIIRITDTAGINADANFTIVDEATTGTDITSEFEFILVSNADGPDNGGLDLDAGVAVPGASDAAEIRDQGIDTNLPAASNWIQRIEPANGAVLKIVDLFELPDGFNFESVTTKEEIQAAFDTGSEADPSPVLQVGDLFTVSKTEEGVTTTFIFRVDEVNVTDNNNDDFYRFSIKS